VAAPLDPETTPEEFRQRALLLADLGRYDEAAGEIGEGLTVAPDEPSLLATLARIHLAAEQPAEALVAAERADAAAPATLTTLVVRAMALTDTRRFGDAARVAGDILKRWPADAYAQRTGAALLSESRNGQEALNAAWTAVRVAPAEAEAHLVLAVVSARLRLFDLAQRAYAEALDLDPAIGDAQHDVGIVRFERRRWAQALEELADDASLPTPAADDGGSYPSPFPRPYAAPDRPEPHAPSANDSASWAGRSAVIRPARPVLDLSHESTDVMRRGVRYVTAGTMLAAVTAAAMTLASEGISRVWAGMIGVFILVGVTVWLNRALTEPLAGVLSRLRAADRPLAGATYLSFAAPVLLPVYAVVGGVVPLAAGMVLAAVAQLLVLTRR
jgi:Flp pilus assembly protein TadD